MRVESLWQRIQAYRSLLAQYHVRDEVVRTRRQRLPARTRLVYSWDAVVGLPFFGYGAVVNALPYYVPRWLAHRMARKETDYATIRLLASIVAFPLFWGMETWLVAWLAGAVWAAAFARLAPAVGADRVSLPDRGRLAAHPAPLRPAGRHPRATRRAGSSPSARRSSPSSSGPSSDYLAATKGSSF